MTLTKSNHNSEKMIGFREHIKENDKLTSKLSGASQSVDFCVASVSQSNPY